MDNVIIAHFDGDFHAVTDPLWRYDNGMRLQFSGIDLPAAYQVHFANEKDGDAIPVYGDDTGAEIPYELLEDGYNVYAWVYVTGDGYGRTKYVAQIPVMIKARPSEEEPSPVQQSALDEAINAVNEAAENLETAAENIPNEINAALEAAKESGEFDGENGADGNGVWYVDVQYTRTTGAGVQAQLNHMVGRPGATPAVGDLCVVSDGRFGSITSITPRVAVVPVLGDLSGKSAYELAVEHGYTGTEAEWLETLKGADAVVDATLSVAGEAADAKATGDELYRHYLELTALSPEIGADTYAWNLRKNYNGSGSYVTADGFGITSNYIPVQPGARVQNTAPERDGNGKYTAMHINEFAGTTWLRRTILASGKYMTIGAGTTSIRIAYGYASNQGVTITQELIDATFSARIIQQPASGSGGGGITVDDALSGSSTNPVQNKVVKAALDGKGTYSKPASGIPTTDMAEDVQASLAKANTALQNHQSLAAYRTAQAQDEIDQQQNTAIAAKYAKPSGGIPASDLAAGVIPTVPSNVSSFTNDAGYLTRATLPVYTGGVS